MNALFMRVLDVSVWSILRVYPASVLFIFSGSGWRNVSFPPLCLPFTKQIEGLDRSEAIHVDPGEGLAEFLGGVEKEGHLVGVEVAVGFSAAADFGSADVLDA